MSYIAQRILLNFNFRYLQRPFSVKFSDPIYENLAPKIIEVNFTIDENGKVSFYINLKRDLNIAFVHLLCVFDGEGVEKQNLIYGNKTVDLCSFFVNRRQSIFLTFLMNVAEKYGNLAKRCPLKKVGLKVAESLK